MLTLRNSIFLIAAVLGSVQIVTAQSTGISHLNKSGKTQQTPSGWTEIGIPGGICAFGTPYRFFYRQGIDPSKMLIYFQGGGACWSWVSCSGLFDSSVGHADSELSGFHGIFDSTNPDNPLQDYSIVFIPYCTGDVHVGDTLRVYGEDKKGPKIHQDGLINVQLVLDWTKTNLDTPDQIVIAGASAGSYGAIFYTPKIAALFPTATIVTIGDSGVPLLKNSKKVLAGWAATVTSMGYSVKDDEPLSLFIANKQAVSPSNVRAVTQITSNHDAIQSAFYLISGSHAWRDSTYGLLNKLEKKIPKFHSFVIAGADHGLMRPKAFYSYEADSTRLVDWIDSLVTGGQVRSVRCQKCYIK